MSERYGLTAQLNRAAASIPSNIAEGSARGSDRDKLRFYYVARGSLAEVATQLDLATRVGVLDRPAELDPMIRRTGRELNALIRVLRAGASD